MTELGLPEQGELEAAYRNPMREVEAFFASRRRRFRVYNLYPERAYDGASSRVARARALSHATAVVRFLDDHNPCAAALLGALVVEGSAASSRRRRDVGVGAVHSSCVER